MLKFMALFFVSRKNETFLVFIHSTKFIFSHEESSRLGSLNSHVQY